MDFQSIPHRKMKYLKEYSAVHVAARNITKYKCVI